MMLLNDTKTLKQQSQLHHWLPVFTVRQGWPFFPRLSCAQQNVSLHQFEEQPVEKLFPELHQLTSKLVRPHLTDWQTLKRQRVKKKKIPTFFIVASVCQHPSSHILLLCILEFLVFYLINNEYLGLLILFKHNYSRKHSRRDCLFSIEREIPFLVS